MITFNLNTLEKQIKQENLTTSDAVKYFIASSLVISLYVIYYPFSFNYLDLTDKVLFITSSLIYTFSIYFIYDKNKKMSNFFNKYIAITFLLNTYAYIINFFVYKFFNYLFVINYYPFSYSKLDLLVRMWSTITTLVIFYFTYRSFERINKDTN